MRLPHTPTQTSSVAHHCMRLTSPHPHRLHRLHITALETTDYATRQGILDEIDTYVVPCALLKNWNNNTITHVPAAHTQRVGFTCLCHDSAHTIQMQNAPCSGIHNSVLLPIQCLFLLPRDSMNYSNLPDLGIFIRGV